MEAYNRKGNRIPGYDYSTEGAYFLTVCTLNRKQILSKLPIGTGLPDCPENMKPVLSKYGKIAEKYICKMDTFYDHISVDRYVIMPDHIHFLLTICYPKGQSGTLVPTESNRRNSEVSKFISTFKRFCNKECGLNIWQGRYYDHVIRNQQDYNEVWEYIENNPRQWILMCGKDQGE